MADVATTPHSSQAAPATWEPRIIGFLFYWCSYTGADSAGTARMKYPANVDIIKVMCSGRIDPELITTAFANGADGVMVLGCHIGDCHYISGNHKTMVRMPLMRRVLRSLLPDGLESPATAPAPRAPAPPVPEFEGMRFPEFTGGKHYSPEGKVDLTYETHSDEVAELPASSLLFDPGEEAPSEDGVFHLRSFGASEYDK